MSLWDTVKTALKNQPVINQLDRIKDYYEPGLGLDPYKRGTLGDQRNSGGGQSPGQSAPPAGSDQLDLTAPSTSYSNGSNSYNAAAAQAAAQKQADIDNAQNAYNEAQFGLDQIGKQRSIGLDNITNSFTNYRNTLNGQKATNERDYGTRRNQTISGYEQARSQINDSTRQKAQGLQRWLASFGAGDSEMARVMAPYSAARVGSQQKAQQETTFSHNLGQMDTGWNDYLGQYNKQLQDIAQQEHEKRNALEAQMLEKQRAGEDARSQAQSALTYAQSGNSALANQQREAALNGMHAILQQIDDLQRQYANPVALTAPTFKPIDVAQYIVDKTPAVQGQTNTQEAIDPSYQNLILKKQQQDNLGL